MEPDDRDGHQETEGRPAKYYRDEYLDKLIQIAMEWRARKVGAMSKKLAEYQGGIAEQADVG